MVGCSRSRNLSLDTVYLRLKLAVVNFWPVGITLLEKRDNEGRSIGAACYPMFEEHEEHQLSGRVVAEVRGLFLLEPFFILNDRLPFREGLQIVQGPDPAGKLRRVMLEI
jgi:hypothetical protein